MNGRHTIQIAGRVGFFCARHFLALLLVVLAGCLLWTVTYFALLLWAAFAGGGLGGPLAYPAGLLFFLVAGAAASLALLFPATALAEWLAGWFGLPVLVQIPLSVAFLALLCLAAVGPPFVAQLRRPLLVVAASAWSLLVGRAECAARFVCPPVRPLRHSPHCLRVCL